MNADMILDAFERVEDRFIMEVKGCVSADMTDAGSTEKRGRGLKRAAVLAAALAALLALCGFAAYEWGLFDPWLQKASADPVETVQSAIEGQLKKEYTLEVRIREISVDEAETKRMIGNYTGSELAQSRGWTDEYLAEHFLAVRAKYYVEYDHTRTFLEDGDIDQFFYLIEDMETGLWTIIDNSTDGQPAAERSV
mgnify:FL=1